MDEMPANRIRTRQAKAYNASMREITRLIEQARANANKAVAISDRHSLHVVAEPDSEYYEIREVGKESYYECFDTEEILNWMADEF